MKYLNEYRDAATARNYLAELHRLTTRPWSVMEICGGQTHSLLKYGIIDLLPPTISMIHGPGCPVCVTPAGIIDMAVKLSKQPDTVLVTFGDMMRVPGNTGSLLKAKADGGQVRMVYSPLAAVQFAVANPDLEVVFLAVGFETTAPANALAVLQANDLKLENFSLLVSHVLVPPAMEALLGDPETKIDGFLAAGHVCTVMGTGEYTRICEKYRIPVVVTGFEPVDLLAGLMSCIRLLESGQYLVDNQYKRVVKDEGNQKAMELVNSVFTKSDQVWRGVGMLPESGLALNDEFRKFDASHRFGTIALSVDEANGCIAGQILKGATKPTECPFFGNTCTPDNPLGAPMVSSEGACAAYYNYANNG